MCMLCNCSPCLPGCPNGEIEECHECEYCHDGIMNGEEYYCYEDNYYHADCFAEIAIDLLIEAGAGKGTAGEE